MHLKSTLTGFGKRTPGRHGAALCIGLASLVMGSWAQGADKGPIAIGTDWELLADDHLIDRVEGAVELRVQSPQIRDVVMVFDKPWEGNASSFHTIFKDGLIYKMYYRGAGFGPVERKPLSQIDLAKGEAEPNHPMVICYAESKDGIHWERPNLGLFEFNGSKDNNIVLMSGKYGEVDLNLGDNAVVFKDTNPEAAADAKYKALVCMDPMPRTLYAMKSADGLTWLPMSNKPVLTNGQMDSHNVAFWDPVRKEYRAYWRYYQEQPPKADGTKVRSVRSIRTASSKDFVNWENEKELTYDDGMTDHLYTGQIAPYYRAPQLLIGFPSRYVERAGEESLDALPDTEERHLRAKMKARYRSALTDSLLVTGRDGVHFKKWPETFLRPGIQREGTWIYGDGFMALGMLETPSPLPGAPAEISLYNSENYGLFGQPSRMRRYVLRQDGFVAAHATRAGGEVITKPLTFAGDELQVNFSTSAGGRVRVEIQDESGKAIPGYTLDECSEVFGDQLERTVHWKNGSDVAKLAGKPVRLRFALEDADLFAFGFKEKKAAEARK